jgi:hypothetical protein
MPVDSKEQKTKALSKILSRILRIDQPSIRESSPDIELIKTLKEKIDIDNPLFRLSMEDFEKMCNNEYTFNIKVDSLYIELYKDKDIDLNKALKRRFIKKLKKICKNIQIFKDNIDSSPNTIKEKMKIKKTKIIDLPDTILTNIVKIYEKTLKYELLDWIPIDKLHWDKLLLNPRAYEFLSLPENREKINWDWEQLSRNPNISKIIKKLKIFGKKSISGNSKSGNSIFSDSKSGDYKSGDSKSGDVANDDSFILNARDNLDWKEISKHSAAIKLLLRNKDKICWTGFSENTSPEAIKILKKKWEKEKSLMTNDTAKYNKMKRKYEIISWGSLSKNINAIDLLREKIEQEKILLENGQYNRLGIDEKIYWDNLSKNSGAIELLEENEDKINWENLSSNTNPKTIKLLKKRIIYEKSLSKSEYNNLRNHISWCGISENPIAIELIQQNSDKICWLYLSKNSRAIDILSLPKNYNDIFWMALSKNINAMNLLRDKYYKEKEDEEKKDKKCIIDCIHWENLSANPSIFILK